MSAILVEPETPTKTGLVISIRGFWDIPEDRDRFYLFVRNFMEKYSNEVEICHPAKVIKVGNRKQMCTIIYFKDHHIKVKEMGAN